MSGVYLVTRRGGGYGYLEFSIVEHEQSALVSSHYESVLCGPTVCSVVSWLNLLESTLLERAFSVSQLFDGLISHRHYQSVVVWVERNLTQDTSVTKKLTTAVHITSLFLPGSYHREKNLKKFDLFKI